MKGEDVIEIIKNSCFKVAMYFPFMEDESRYEKALEIELSKQAGLDCEFQRTVPVLYEGKSLRDVRDEIDIVVWFEENGKRKALIVELKVNISKPVTRFKAINQAARYKTSLAQEINEEVHEKAVVVNFYFPSTDSDFKKENNSGVEFILV